MIHIKIRSVDFEVTSAIEEYVHKKIGSLDKFLPGDENVVCNMEIGRATKHQKSGDVFRAEINILLPGNVQIFAEAEKADLYMAIDAVHGEAEREIVSKKKKRFTLFRRGAARLKNMLRRNK